MTEVLPIQQCACGATLEYEYRANSINHYRCPTCHDAYWWRDADCTGGLVVVEHRIHDKHWQRGADLQRPPEKA